MEHATPARSPGFLARLLLGVHLAAGPLIGIFGTGAVIAGALAGRDIPLALFLAIAAPGMALGVIPSNTTMIACAALHGWNGAASLFPAMILASIPGFLAIRHAFRDEARALLSANPRVRGPVQRLEEWTFPVATLLRIAPVSTFAWTNAILSTSTIRVLPYLASTALGILPRLLLLTWAGTSGRDLAATFHDGASATSIAGLVVSVVALLALGWIALRLLRPERGPEHSGPE